MLKIEKTYFGHLRDDANCAHLCTDSIHLHSTQYSQGLKI